MLRVYCTWPGVSATTKRRRWVAKIERDEVQPIPRITGVDQQLQRIEQAFCDHIGPDRLLAEDAGLVGRRRHHPRRQRLANHRVAQHGLQRLVVRGHAGHAEQIAQRGRSDTCLAACGIQHRGVVRRTSPKVLGKAFRHFAHQGFEGDGPALECADRRKQHGVERGILTPDQIGHPRHGID
jgi:hypothetical protein